VLQQRGQHAQTVPENLREEPELKGSWRACRFWVCNIVGKPHIQETTRMLYFEAKLSFSCLGKL